MHNPSIPEDPEAQSTEKQDSIHPEVRRKSSLSVFLLLFSVYFLYLLSASILSKTQRLSQNPYALCIISAILLLVTGGLTAVQAKFPQNPYIIVIIFWLLPVSIAPISLYLSGNEFIQVGCTMTSLLAVCVAMNTCRSWKEGILWRRALLTLVPIAIQMSLLGISYRLGRDDIWWIILLSLEISMILSFIAIMLKKQFPQKTSYLSDCSMILEFAFYAMFWDEISMGLSNSLREHENLDFKVLSLISATSLSLIVTGIFMFISYKRRRGEENLTILDLAFLTALPFVITMIIDNLVNRTLALL